MEQREAVWLKAGKPDEVRVGEGERPPLEGMAVQGQSAEQRID